MLWILRGAIMLLGVLAWGISYYLATVAMGNSVPKNLPGLLIASLVVYAGVCIWLIKAENRADRLGSIRELERDAHSVAAGIRDLAEIPVTVTDANFLAPGGFETFDVQALAKAQKARVDLIVAHYEQRFAGRVRFLASEFRKYPVPQTDVFFRLVDEGPRDDEKVFQVALGLERLAGQLREKPLGRAV
jgi:hypothetical protein